MDALTHELALRSTFTCEAGEIRRLGAAFGWVTSGAGTALNHNLPTVVVSISGRVQNVFIGNEWTPHELIEELSRATKMPQILGVRACTTPDSRASATSAPSRDRQGR
jgi:hypothetical protein